MIRLVKFFSILLLAVLVSACGDKGSQTKSSSSTQAGKGSNYDSSTKPEDSSFVALFVCGIQSPQGIQNLNIMACFSGGSSSVDTELEIRNGGQYGLYKAWNIMQLGQMDNNGFKIDLNSNFAIRAQNSSDSLILGLKIIGAQTGKVYFEKQVGKYGVISVEN